MADFARKCFDNWVLTVSGSEEQHQAVIRETLAKRAYELFELRGREHGHDLEDWVVAEQELVYQNLNGNSSGFCILVDSPPDPDITTILSVTSRSLLVFRSHTRAAHNPVLVGVHLLPAAVNVAETAVEAVDGILQVHLPKQRQKRGSAPSYKTRNLGDL
ncbi:MAG TPA: DUF2934 domain-containing protein [Candidatus Sulfotelmatobacter sp.]|jgi:hypothetical protein